MLEARQILLERGGRRLLDGVGVTVRPGRLLAIVGPNGAGKSTLLKVLSGQLKPDGGEVALDGRPLAAWPRLDLARRRAVLPQQSTAGSFGLTAFALAALGLSPYRGRLRARREREIVMAALTACAVAPLAERQVASLSGGELQRVELARVLAQLWEAAPPNPPGFLLLDEPTASLDVVQQTRVLELAKQHAARGYGVAAIVHDLTIALRLADDALLLAAGRALGEGPVDAVFTAEALSLAFAAPLARQPLAGRSLEVIVPA